MLLPPIDCPFLSQNCESIAFLLDFLSMFRSVWFDATSAYRIVQNAYCLVPKSGGVFAYQYSSFPKQLSVELLLADIYCSIRQFAKVNWGNIVICIFPSFCKNWISLYACILVSMYCMISFEGV